MNVFHQVDFGKLLNGETKQISSKIASLYNLLQFVVGLRTDWHDYTGTYKHKI